MSAIVQPGLPQDRIGVLYIAPWVDYGGTDKGTVDWFRCLDRTRFRPYLITTQPSPNRMLSKVVPFAEEIWVLPDLMAGDEFPYFILNFVQSRRLSVVHVMNSRLGFMLVPDLRSLPDPPRVVVQLHVEEEDRSGYVRYVCTRYGGLVDAFSVTSRQLRDALPGYGVPRRKCHVIYTGVDAEQEFSPARAAPALPLEPGMTRVLFPARLVEQKNPELMVEVAARLRRRTDRFRIHVVGEGPLESSVREAVERRGLEDHVLLHGSTSDMAPWFAACDVTLLTSRFEGIPYVAFESMAMARPVVAPVLPGLLELVADGCGHLVERDDADGYVEALARFIADPPARARAGETARAHVRANFSLAGMARAHEELYAALVQTPAPDATPAPAPARVGQAAAPIRCGQRPASGEPLVSVIVPCFNETMYLEGCIASIRHQTYGNLETIIVDDGSTDPDALAVLDKIAMDSNVAVIRLEENQGPGVARNVALERAAGRYVLPVDADNLLTPNAVSDLVRQLQAAGEEIGFIYPNAQFFGNRDDYWTAPEYNLFGLLEQNFCDTCSLIDREVFDHGVRYSEDRLIGHEDWDFALRLAARGVHGEPAQTPTLLYRKRSYARADTIEYGIGGPYRTPEVDPALMDRARIKARWSPAVSIVALEPIDADGAWADLVAHADGQTCTDFELLVRRHDELAPPNVRAHIRRLPPDLADSPAAALATALPAARGRWILATAGTGAELLEEPTFVEKLIRAYRADRYLGGIAFVTGEQPENFPYQLLAKDNGASPAVHALSWESEGHPARADVVDVGLDAPLRDLAPALAQTVDVQWRHWPPTGPASTARRTDARMTIRLSAILPPTAAQEKERRTRLSAQPEVTTDRGVVRRLDPHVLWRTPEVDLLCRHRSEDGGAFVHSLSVEPPEGYVFHFILGGVNRYALPGTLSLWSHAEETGVVLETSPVRPSGDAFSLGHLEEVPYPMLEPLRVGCDPLTGGHMLVGGDDDPLAGRVEEVATLGWVDPYPIAPRRPPRTDFLSGWRIGLVRAVDPARRTHVYGAGRIPKGTLAGELGSLRRESDGDDIPVWIDERGFLATERDGEKPRASVPDRWRYVFAPIAWRGFSAPARARASTRRIADVLRPPARRAGASGVPQGTPDGYLAPRAGPHRIPLYSAIHSVTGDQLLSDSPDEAERLGYPIPVLLGYLERWTPVTGRLGAQKVDIPWARHFGRSA